MDEHGDEDRIATGELGTNNRLGLVRWLIDWSLDWMNGVPRQYYRYRRIDTAMVF